jgi:aminoglycoside phosphotransferase family enzyme
MVATERPAAPGLGPLRAALSRARPRRRLVVIDTRMSQVLLAGPWAIKLRRAWPAFDQPQARRTLLESELRCNRRVSPSVYVGVFPIAGAGAGADAAGPAYERGVSAGSPVLGWPMPRSRPAGGRTAVRLTGGDSIRATLPEPVDWALVMRRLPRASMLDQAISRGTVSCADIDRLADRLAALYGASRVPRIAPARVLARIDREQACNRRQLLCLADRLSRPPDAARARLTTLLDRSDSAWRSHRGTVAARAVSGAWVEAHGDLRPEHVCLTDPIELIDRLEFDPMLRRLDAWEELCLLALLCAMAGAAWIGERLSKRLAPRLAGQLPSARLRSFYCAHHALVRARLALLHLRETGAPRSRHWRDLTLRYLGYAEAALDGWDSLSG